MYVLVKDGKYFTGDVVSDSSLDIILWTRHPAGAKVWKQKRIWAEKAADRWGGTVVEWREDSSQAKVNLS